MGEGGRQNWAINGRFLTQRVTGVQRYAYEIVSALDEILADQTELAQKVEFRLIAPPGAKRDLTLSRVQFQQTKSGSGHRWDQSIFPFYSGSGVLSLGNFGPLLVGKQILCIHDANTFIEPESYSRAFRLAYCNLLPLMGKRATRVATVSQFSADMLVRYGVCTPDKIFIAPNGHEHVLRWDARRSKNTLLRTLTRPYVLLLGSRAKHKNVEVVLGQARRLDAAGIDIVVVGGEANIFSVDEPRAALSNVHYAGYVDDDDLAAFYEGALCLVFPSKTEGFGIPPLEAMVKGCPVICSNIAVLVEVGGDSAIYVNPDDANGWINAIVDLSTNVELRSSMVDKGSKRVALFSWKRSAAIYINEILDL